MRLKGKVMLIHKLPNQLSDIYSTLKCRFSTNMGTLLTCVLTGVSE